MLALIRRLALRKVREPRLRPYRAADLPALHALDQVCFPPGIAYSRAELRSFIEHPSSFTVIASSGEAVHGFAVVRPVRRQAAEGDRALHILTIDVAPDHRRNGVGSSLMAWMFGKAEQLGSAAIVLEVAVDNHPAQAFYKRHGFQVVATIPGYYNGVIDAFELVRQVGRAQCAP